MINVTSSINQQFTDPSTTALGRNAGVIGLGMVGTTSLLLSPLIGVISGVFLTFKIINDLKDLKELEKKAKSFATQHTVEKIDLAEMKSKMQSLVPASNLDALIDQKDRELRRHADQLIASLFAMIPVLGVIASGMYLLAATPSIKDRGIYGMVEATMQHLTIGLQKTVEEMFYPLRGRTLEEHYKVEGDELEQLLKQRITDYKNAKQAYEKIQNKTGISKEGTEDQEAKTKYGRALHELTWVHYRRYKLTSEGYSALRAQPNENDAYWSYTGALTEKPDELTTCQPLNIQECVQARKDNMKEQGMQETEITVNRGDSASHKIKAYFIPSVDGNPDSDRGNLVLDKPTVVIFHGNGMTALDCEAQIKTYREKYNVVTVTMGGYPDSDVGIRTSEISSYQDANAVIQHLKSLGVKDVIVHGTSMGGSLAFAAAELHPDVVKIVVAHHTFNRAKDVAANMLKNNLSIPGLVPAPLIRGVIGAAFPEGQIVPGVFKDGEPYKTDGLDNVRKAAHLNNDVKVIVLGGPKDSLMGVNKNKSNENKEQFLENLADNIVRARPPSSKDGATPQAISVGEGHASWRGDYIEKNLMQEIQDFFENKDGVMQS